MEFLRLAGVVRESITDGPGLRFTVFCQGCPHECPKCHNVDTWNFDAGKDVAVDKIIAEIEKNPLLQGVTFSGGEPFCQAEGFSALADGLRASDKCRQMDIMVYTGYRYEELVEMSEENTKIRELMEKIDILVDGKFEDSKRDISLRFRGSSNQRIIDMKSTLEKGEIVFAKKYLL